MAVIRGNWRANTLYGTEGDDYVAAGGGHDTVDARGGNDRVYLGSGNDVAYGGLGDDMLAGGDGDDRIDGGLGRDELWGGKGADTISVALGDVASGDTGNDVITHTAEEFVRYHEYMPSQVSGGRGYDTLRFDGLACQGWELLDEETWVILHPNSHVYTGTELHWTDDGRGGSISGFVSAGGWGDPNQSSSVVNFDTVERVEIDVRDPAQFYVTDISPEIQSAWVDADTVAFWV